MKKEQLREEVIRSYRETGNGSETGRILFQKLQPEGSEKSFIRKVHRIIKSSGVKRSSSSRSAKKKTAQKFELSAWTKDGKIMSLDQFCEHHELPKQNIRDWRLCTHTKVPTYNISWKTVSEIQLQEDLTLDFIQQTIKELSRPLLISYPKVKRSPITLRLIFTDAHVAMETNAGGFGLYGGVWNEEELFHRGEKMLEEIRAVAAMYGSFEEIHLVDLGDYMDGWDGKTVRKGHDLPQNMDNKKAFRVGVKFKIWLIRSLVELNITPKIRGWFVCNDNHSGDFGYIVNHTVKLHLEELLPEKVEIHLLQRFMSHYIHGGHCFILTHGKDEKNLKFGFPVHLDKKGSDKIHEYIDHFQLDRYWITLEKGDSHQALFDHTTSDKFNYHNYPALSPSSEWIQTNYKKGRSGFQIQLMRKDRREIMMLPVEFDWKDSA